MDILTLGGELYTGLSVDILTLGGEAVYRTVCGYSHTRKGEKLYTGLSLDILTLGRGKNCIQDCLWIFSH